jgi:Fe2+ or Zn2+ uptake regulation protein
MSTTELALPVNYRTIFGVVEAAGPGSHLSAAEIWQRARAIAPRMGFATVHRGLIRLHELGMVMKFVVPGEASAMYEPTASPHAHFRCTACGAISDLSYAVGAATLRSLSAKHHLSIDAGSVTFTGRCAGCSG